MIEKILIACLVFFLPILLSQGDDGGGQSGVMTVKDLLAIPRAPADFRIFYGDDPQQFGELRLPAGQGPFPVAVIIHGGCWLSDYNLDHISPLAAALTGEGLATWSLEYRRIGDRGGGWPGTFIDAAAGLDHLRTLAHDYDLDPDRVVVVGHSAGGHLALWLSVRNKLDSSSALYSSNPLPLTGVVSLAGIGDLELALKTEICGDSVSRLMGGPPEKFPERYALGSPVKLLPAEIPQLLIQGLQDTVVPAESVRSYDTEARRCGQRVDLVLIPGVGHYELIIPGTPAWPEVRKAVLDLLHRR